MPTTMEHCFRGGLVSYLGVSREEGTEDESHGGLGGSAEYEAQRVQ